MNLVDNSYFPKEFSLEQPAWRKAVGAIYLLVSAKGDVG